MLFFIGPRNLPLNFGPNRVIKRSDVVVVVVGGGGGVRGFVAVVLDAFVAVFVDPRNLPVEFGQIRIRHFNGLAH